MQKSRENMKFIHITIVAFSIIVHLFLLPLHLELEAIHYLFFQFISTFASHETYTIIDVLFYAFILPFCINQPAGSTFNLLTLYKVLNLKQQLINKVTNLE